MSATAGPELAPNPYGLRFQLPYLAGVYLAVNAIPDAALVVDGPMCAVYKIEQIQGNHDIRAELSRLTGSDRILHTNLQVNEAVMGEEKPFLDALGRAARSGDSRVILTTGSSCSLLIGRDIDRLARTFEQTDDTPVLPIRSRTLSGDWLDGYEETLVALAKRLTARPCEKPEPSPEKRPRVGIVGYFHTRNEGDSAGDLAELERLVRGAGGELASVWLSGKPYAQLADIAGADILVSFPYGTRAARILARHSGADLLKLPYPFSAEHATGFVRGLAAHMGTQAQAEAFIEAETARMAHSLLFLSQQHLLSSRWFVVADASHAAGFVQIARDAGAFVAGVLIPSRARRDDPALLSPFGGEPLPLAYGSVPGWDDLLRQVREREPLDLIVAGSSFSGPAMQIGCPHLEFGYPSYTYHPVLESPSLGFRGELALISRMAETLARERLASDYRKRSAGRS